MEQSRFQKDTIEVIPRSKIKNATYNPRHISQDAKNKLKRALKEHGLVATLTWNRRTGNLVSGHQRLAALDALEGSQDYKIRVSAVDVDEREEKVLNVQMNNPDMMGEWDLDALAEMNLNAGISFEEMGFADLSVDMLFEGDSRFSEIFQEDDEATKQAKGTLAKIKEDRKKIQERQAEENSADFYAMLIFKSQVDKDEFMRAIGQPVFEKYVNGQIVMAKLARVAK